MKRGVFIILGLCLLLGPTGYSCAQGQFLFENPLVGEQAPDFKLKTASGKEMSFSQTRENKPAIIFFWATWCPHCRQQLKVLNDGMAKIEEKGYKVVIVDIEEKAEDVKPYIEKNQIKAEVFLDEEGAVSGLYNLVGIPTFFFVDQNGKVEGSTHALPANYLETLGPKQ
ncbi:MAG: peroxiredoxin family protein [Candidatus Omnitrophica bacterium]|nr:peroxiredoxin family protein [Candidatus Omnitrophota bacterium]